MNDLFTGGEAHARRSDPATSHQAAEAVTPDLRQLQAQVADYAKRQGARGFTDAQMSADLEDETSTFRTRRSELTARNIIIDSGDRRQWGDSPRQRIVWVHRDFVPAAPPITDAPVPATPAEKADGRRMADKLLGFSTSMMKEGRAMFANELANAAALMRRLAS
jgi:hypothetical protein